jgi:uncharacterized membrane protein YgcG
MNFLKKIFNSKTKILIIFSFITAFIISLFLPIYSNAGSTVNISELNNQFAQTLNGVNIYSQVFRGSMGAFLCDIRRLFCGPLTQVLLATGIFTIGILVLTQKITWGYVIMFTAVSTIFVKPEILTDELSTVPIIGGLPPLEFGFINNLCVCFKGNEDLGASNPSNSTGGGGGSGGGTKEQDLISGGGGGSNTAPNNGVGLNDGKTNETGTGTTGGNTGGTTGKQAPQTDITPLDPGFYSN